VRGLAAPNKPFYLNAEKIPQGFSSSAGIPQGMYSLQGISSTVEYL
jgi:hypothetical protein